VRIENKGTFVEYLGHDGEEHSVNVDEDQDKDNYVEEDVLKE
jgi:hypothetical protein